MLKLNPLLALCFSIIFLLSCKTQNSGLEMKVPHTNAPEINTKYGWVNTDKAYSIKDFKGKFVLLDFWTFGCINCQHIISDLERLEQEYKKELIVIGIHSGKFTGEKANARIQKAIVKFGINHPVVNDADFKVWDSYAVNAWPTVVLIDPEGKVAGQKSGEGVYSALKPFLDSLIPKYKNHLSEKEVSFNLKHEHDTPLKFPSKIIATTDGYIWIADSGNNRILKITTEGKVLDTIGSGMQGDKDGAFNEASFYEPHGLAQKGDFLYIADSKNNKIKVANLISRTIKTVAGTGKLDYYYFEDKLNENVSPNSPWDLLIIGEEMFVASAGNHQILKMDLNTHKIIRFAGTGREALADGTLREAAFNQPSGLAFSANCLYVADPEASAVRIIYLKDNEVETLIGKGLFDFGDIDGSFKDALIQHPVGIEFQEGKLYIADTYNGKLKVADLKEKMIMTLISGLNEPNDVLFLNGSLYVTNTNNHELLKLNLDKKTKEIVNLQ